MKKLISIIVVFAFTLTFATPVVNVYAQSPKGNSTAIIVDENLLSGTESFSIVKRINNNDSVIIPYGTTEFYVTLRKLTGGSLLAQWNYGDTSTITKVYLTMKLNYRTSGLDFTWDEYASKLFNYSGGLGKTEENEHTWAPTKAGHYRACVSGTITTTGGTRSVYGCSGTVAHDGKIIIASKPEGRRFLEK